MSEHSDVGTRVATALHELTPPAELSSRIADRTRARAVRRRASVTGVALFTLVAMLGSLVALVASGPNRGRDDLVADDVSASYRWESLPTAPIPRRADAGVAWTGTEVVVWGGGSTSSSRSGLRSDGAAFDPSAGRWRVLPPAPIGPRGGPLTAWTGVEVIVWGGWRPEEGGRSSEPTWHDGAAYDPSADTWRRIADAPIEGYEAWAWTGTELVVFGRKHSSSGTVAAAYDPVRDTWRMLPDLGFTSNTSAWAEWTGDELLYWRPGTEQPRLFAYDPADDAWREVEIPTDEFPAFWNDVVVVWTGNRLVAAARAVGEEGTWSETEVVDYDPRRGRWRRVGRTGSLEAYGPSSSVVWNGHEVVVLSSHSLSVLDPATGTRGEAPEVPGHLVGVSAVATDNGDIYMFGEETNTRLVREPAAR